jgi:hypothetical protein
MRDKTMTAMPVCNTLSMVQRASAEGLLISKEVALIK